MSEFVKIDAQIDGLRIKHVVELPEGAKDAAQREDFLLRAFWISQRLIVLITRLREKPTAQLVPIGQPRPKRKL